MELKDQVCSLELSKRLKELGVRQDSLFWWYKEHSEKRFSLGLWKPDGYYVDGVWQGYYDTHSNKPAPIYSAFTASELGEMLPSYRGFTVLQSYSAKNNKGVKKWYCSYQHQEDMKEVDKKQAKTEVDARAKMLIYLLENQLINS